MMKRTGTPWMSAVDYAATLQGLVVNLLTANIVRSLEFQRTVLNVNVVYADEDFAAIEHAGSKWMLHADHSYNDHPLSGIIHNAEGRGMGAELRVFGRDPDVAAGLAEENGFTVLAGAMDKDHGTRESFILDDDGYLWSPTVLTPTS